MRTLEQRKDIDELARQVEELEELRRKQSRKIANLKSEANYYENNTQEKRVVSDNAVQALSSELRTTENSLDNVQHREKQVSWTKSLSSDPYEEDVYFRIVDHVKSVKVNGQVGLSVTLAPHVYCYVFPKRKFDFENMFVLLSAS